MIAKRYSPSLIERLRGEMPFTNLSVRLNEDGTPKPGFAPYNQIDEIAMHHDYCYSKADQDPNNNLTRKDCDKKMLDELNEVKTKGFREN